MVQATTSSPPTTADRALAAALYAVVQGSRRVVRDPVDRVTMTMLADVHRLQPIRPSDLAEELRLDLSTVSRHVTALVDRGLLDRVSDPTDARAQQILLTPEGEAVFAEVVANRAAILGAAVRGWSAADRRRLVEGLERLAEDLAEGSGDTA